MKKGKVYVGVKMDATLADRLDRLAAKQKRGRSQMIRLAIEEAADREGVR